jgi:hypothetical protein
VCETLCVLAGLFTKLVLILLALKAVRLLLPLICSRDKSAGRRSGLPPSARQLRREPLEPREPRGPRETREPREPRALPPLS